jgi:hypothetical protein
VGPVDSLSVGDLVYDEQDTTGNTLAVAIGTRSSFLGWGGIPIGIFYTTNALATKQTWKVLDNAAGGLGSIDFRTAGLKFNAVFVRGDLMMASAYQDDATGDCGDRGIYRSTDRGITWKNVLKGVGRAISSDPNDPTRFYAVIDFAEQCGTNGVNNVFTSTDSRESWTPTASASPNPTAEGKLSNAKLSVSKTGSRVWAALVVVIPDPANYQYTIDVVDAISFSDDKGATWTTMDPIQTPDENGNPFGITTQGYIHFSMLASPTDSNTVFVGGNSQDGGNVRIFSLYRFVEINKNSHQAINHFFAF